MRKTIFDKNRKGKKTNNRRMICEIHREIYDLCVINLLDEKPELFEEIVDLLEEAYITGVKMTNRLAEHNLKDKELFFKQSPSKKQLKNRKERNRIVWLKKEMELRMEEYGEIMKNRKLKHTELKETFENMSSEDLSDYRVLSKFIYNKVGIGIHIENCEIKNPKEMFCWGGLESKQYPDELAKLLVYLYENRNKINSYCEIGPFKGGTFFTIDSFLRAVNPDMGESLAVDVKNNMEKHGFDEYKKKYPQVSFLLKDSLEFVPERNFDFCFIDGNHHYEYVEHDYENMKKHCKILGFHDIHITKAPYDGVKRFWEELGIENKIEFVNEDDRFVLPVGIGVIEIG